MSVPTFPSEILYLFLDELGSAAIKDPQSRAALLACTLVNTQFYHQASSYIFSSLFISTLHSQKRLNALFDILNSNPDITRHIRSLIMEIQIYTVPVRLHAILRQLCHLQKLGWIEVPERPAYCNVTPPTGNLCNLPSLPVTALHFENVLRFPLSLFPACYQLESLTLVDVRFLKMGSKPLPGSLFLSLRTLKISASMWSNKEVEAVTFIMTRAAPTLTTLILSKTGLIDPSSPDLNSTVFPVLESIQISCAIGRVNQNKLLTFISQFLDYSAPMVSQIQIEFIEFDEFLEPDQPFIFNLTQQGWLSIDDILSSSKYPSLKTLDLTFSERHPPPVRYVQSETQTSGLIIGSSARTLLNKILPAVSSRSQIEYFEPLHTFTGIRFNF